MIDSSFAQNTHLHRNPELDIADDALAATMLPVSSAAGPQAELAQQDRIAAFKDLGVRDARVGHVRVYTAGAVPGRTGAGTAGYGLVVAEALCGGGGGGEVAAKAEGQIVAVALGGGTGGEGKEDHVSYALGG